MKRMLASCLLLVVVGGLFWFVQEREPVAPTSTLPRPTPPPTLTLPSDGFLFAPKNCGFRLRMAGTPEISTQERGELSFTIATARHSSASVRASCGPYIVQDREALEAHLPEQMKFAARNAGLSDYQTDIRKSGNSIVASYEGVRGTGAAARFIRSETWVRNNRFMEILYMVDPDQASDQELKQIAELEPDRR